MGANRRSTVVSCPTPSAAGLLGDALVVTYDLGDDELEELLGELGIESRFDGELAKALDLLLLAARVGWRQSFGRLELPTARVILNRSASRWTRAASRLSIDARAATSSAGTSLIR